jgi:translation initiation factor IF-2
MSKTEEKTIQLPYSLSVRELAGLLNTSAVTVIKILMSNGVMANINPVSYTHLTLPTN